MKNTQAWMLKGGVEEGWVIVWRRGASLVRLPVTWQDRGVIFTEACNVTAQEGHLGVSTLGEGEEPKQTDWDKLPRLACTDRWIEHRVVTDYRSLPAEFPVLAAVALRHILQFLRWEDHATVGLLILKPKVSVLIDILDVICFQISRSGGVFLHQGWFGPRKANAQKSAVWPCPSCNCTDWVQIEKASWK